jgi:hypothetical protein
VSGQLHSPATLPWGKSPIAYWIEGWVAYSDGLDDMIREISLVPAKQGSPHRWEFSKAHTGSQFAHGFRAPVYD